MFFLVVFAAIGLACLLGFDMVLATATKHLTSASAQTLILLENDFFLPVWMGWVLFAVGIAALVPPVSWFAMLATMLWVLIAGIWMVKQGPPAIEREPAAVAGEPVMA
jgi:hypothetical protein